MGIFFPKQAEHFEMQRKKHGFTQAELCKAIDRDLKTYRKWEKGCDRPDCDVLVQLSELYDVSSDYLLGLIDEKDHDVKFVCEYTGLSENAILKLKSLEVDTLNHVLTSEHFKKILDMISNSAKFADRSGNIIAKYIQSKVNNDKKTAALLEASVKGGGDTDLVFRANTIAESALLFDEVSSILYDLKE